MKKRELTPKQKAFADEYIKTGNAYQSAIKAGYSKAYAKSDATKLRENTGVKAYIDKKLTEIESHKIADAQEVLELLTSIMRGEEREEVVVATTEGAEKVQKTPSLKERMNAAKEIIKRYPNSDADPIMTAKAKKLQAEARIMQYKADLLTSPESVDDRTMIIDDVPGVDIDEEN